MDLDALYEVLIDDVEIQVWCPNEPDFTDGIIYEGGLYKSHKVVAPYMYRRIVQIEVDDHGKLYVCIDGE